MNALLINTVSALTLSSALLAASVVQHDAHAREATATADGFKITSSTLELTVSNGAVTRLVNRLTREVHATPITINEWMPRGIICGKNSAQNSAQDSMLGVQTFHGGWGTHQLYNGQLADVIARIDHYPSAASKIECTTITAGSNNALESGIRCVWVGLTDGVTAFPADRLVIEATVDVKSGRIALTANGSSAECDVVGVSVPIVNLHPRHTIYVPSLGGLAYTPADLVSGKIITLGGAPFIEAPVIAAEGDSGSIALWSEDSAFRPYFTLLGGNDKAHAFTLEELNYMPFTGQRTTRTVTTHVNAFVGSWPSAMNPFREWYERTFADEIKRRNAIAWPRDISVICDAIGPGPTALSTLARLLDPRATLLQEWNPRRASFDSALPDWTPSIAFPKFVQQAHALGFKVMGYVNTMCVNFNSPVFVRDRVAEFGLTRRFGSVTTSTASPKSFVEATDQEILYLDPLSPRWRAYHTDMMVQWRQSTGADANYEDTSGTAGDFGNGEVGGLRGAQGGWAQMRELQSKNPVPMASEFAPDNIAFAPMWTLRYSQLWGNDELRVLWSLRHRPISSRLFAPGCRAWVPTVNASSERAKSFVVACSDALGGVAQLEATRVSFEARTGMARHMVERARLFARLNLVPTFDSWPKDPRVVCQYRDARGVRYHYRSSPQLQELVGLEGAALYQRVLNCREFKSALRVPGWPAWSADTTIALNPRCTYALSREASALPSVHLDKCPAGVSITRFIDTPEFALINFTDERTNAATATVGLVAHAAFTEILLGARDGSVTRQRTPLKQGQRIELSVVRPVFVLLLRAPAALAVEGRALGSAGVVGKFVSDYTGIERGGEFPLNQQVSWRLGGASIATPLAFVSGGGDCEIAFDHLLAPGSSNAAIEVAFMNTQRQFGDGCTVRAYINGVLVHSENLGPRTNAAGEKIWDTAAHVWQVPLGSHAGRPVVVTLAVWGNADDNADEIWMSTPRIVRAAQQTITSRTVNATPN